MTDAIRTAQAWLAKTTLHELAYGDWHQYKDAERGLAALGPASVALAVALERFVGPASQHSQCREPESCAICAARDSLAAWTEAVTQPAE